jgi:hypothetical protein
MKKIRIYSAICWLAVTEESVTQEEAVDVDGQGDGQLIENLLNLRPDDVDDSILQIFHYQQIYDSWVKLAGVEGHRRIMTHRVSAAKLIGKFLASLARFLKIL